MNDIDTLAADWLRAAPLLGIEVVAPFSVKLRSQQSVSVSALVKGFGARNGMLLATDYEMIRPHAKALMLAGYGYSIMNGPRADEAFDLDSFKEVLRDWSWAGAPGSEPPWYTEGSGSR